MSDAVRLKGAGHPNKFPREARLNKPAEFRYVFARPRVSSDRYFRILSRSNDVGNSRLGMAVSRKVCKHAAGRNRIKRIIRESFRAYRTGLGPNGGLDIVVLPSGRAASICNKALSDSLRRHWHELASGGKPDNN